jgi:hypothetical protein
MAQKQINKALLALIVSMVIGGMIGYYIHQKREGSDRFRMGERTLRLAVWGDVRPSCRNSKFDTVTPKVFELLNKLDKEKPFDLVIATGDYVCARPWEGQQAQAQLEYITSIYPKQLWFKTIAAPGNHEIGHGDLCRYSKFNILSEGGYYDYEDLRVVVLPSEINELATNRLSFAWIKRAAAHSGRLVAVRHEPPGSCGTRHAWIMSAVQNEKPNLVFYGHVHTWLAPGSHYEDCGRKLALAENEIIVGNGGASGWEEKNGWAGVTVIEMYPDGRSLVQAVDVENKVRTSAHVLSVSR